MPKDGRQAILFISSSYPTLTNKNSEFIRETCHELAKHFKVIVLLPKRVDYDSNGISEDFVLTFHNITPFGDFGFSTGNGILPNIKKKPLLAMLVPFYLVSLLISIAKLVRDYNIRVIHANWIFPAGIISVIYKLLFNRKIRILCTLHGSDMNMFTDPISILLKRITLKQLDTLSAVSSDLAEKANRLGYRGTITLTPVGVYTDVFTPRAQPYINSHTLLYVGRLITSKGVAKLVRAFNVCLRYCPNATLVMIGAGDEKESLQQLSRELGSEGNIKFTGLVPHSALPQYYKDANVFVLPSSAEGFPISLSEALSSGLVCVTSDIPVFQTLADKYRFIKTIDINNIEGFGKLLADTLLDEEFLITEGENARLFACNYLDRRETNKQYVDILKLLTTM